MKHLKSLFLSLMAISFAINVHAYDFEVDGIYYNVLSREDLTCEVTSGDNKYEGDIEIPKTVDFKGRTMKVVKIGSSGFDGSGIVSIVIPESIEEIGESAFRNCSKLTNVEFKTTHFSIGDNAFYKCSSIESIDLPDEITEIGEGAFENCNNLKMVHLPESLKVIPKSCFEECDLREVILPKNVERVNYYAFAINTNLAKIILNEGLKYIGDNGFYLNCAESITIPSTVDSICEAGLYSYMIETLFIPSTVKYLEGNISGGEYGGAKGGRLTNLIFEDCAEPIELNYDLIFNGYSSYYNNFANKATSLKMVYIGRDLNTKCKNGSYSLRSQGCFNKLNLEKVVVGPNCTYLDAEDFIGCTRLKEVTFLDSSKPLSINQVLKSYSTISEIGLFDDSKLEKVYLGRELNPNNDIGDPFGSAQDVIIGDNVSSLPGTNLFKNVKRISIGMSLNPIPDETIPQSGVESITINNINPPVYSGKFDNKTYLNTTLNVPKGGQAAYLTSEPWKNFWNIEELDEIILSLKEINGDKNTRKDGRVYNLEGKMVAVVRTPEELKTLPSGLYIMNGRRFIVR